jgi:hypothetical protein
MTAMADKLKAAGVNTGVARLYTAACELLRKAKTPEKALHPLWQKLVADREMRETLMLDYLRRVAADMRAGEAAAGEGQTLTEAQAPSAPPAAGSIRVKAHDVRAHRRRTQKEKDIEIAAQMGLSTAIYDRRTSRGPLGDVRYEQLPSSKRESADHAASYLRLGTEKTEEAILWAKIEGYARVEDGRTRVREVIPAEKLHRLAIEAHTEAPQLVERGMHEYATRIIAERGIDHAP